METVNKLDGGRESCGPRLFSFCVGGSDIASTICNVRMSAAPQTSRSVRA